MTDDLDAILIHVKDALELAREKDEPRDMEMRFILALAVNELEAYRQDEWSSF